MRLRWRPEKSYDISTDGETWTATRRDDQDVVLTESSSHALWLAIKDDNAKRKAETGRGGLPGSRPRAGRPTSWRPCPRRGGSVTRRVAAGTARAYAGTVDAQRVDAAAFARDGVACVRGVLNPQELASAARAIDIVLAAPGPLALVASSPDDPGSFTEDFCRWGQIPEIEELARHSAVPRLAAELMATPEVRFYHDHILVKQGGTRQRTPWHQDQPYYNVDGRGISAWIPVDPVPGEGSLELLAGSHAGPWLMPRTFLDDGEARWFPEGSLAELPDIEADRSAFGHPPVRAGPGGRGVLRLPDLRARAPGLPVRRAVAACSPALPVGRGPSTPRGPGRTSPPFEGLADESPPGAPMNHPLFPLVWPASLGPPPGRVSGSGSRPGSGGTRRLRGGAGRRRGRWRAAGRSAGRSRFWRSRRRRPPR